MSLNVKGVKIRVADAAAQVGVGPKASSSAAAATAAGATVAGPSPQDNLRKTGAYVFMCVPGRLLSTDLGVAQPTPRPSILTPLRLRLHIPQPGPSSASATRPSGAR